MRLVQGSLEPTLQITLYDGDAPGATAADLSAATAVQIRGELQGQEIFLHDVAGPFPNTGVLSMDWVAGDTDNPGRIWLDVKVTWAGGRIQWFPAGEVVDVEAL
jgi:hypothetical protein